MNWEEVKRLLDEAIAELGVNGPPLILPGEMDHLDRIVGRYPAWECQKPIRYSPNYIRCEFERIMLQDPWGETQHHLSLNLRLFD